MVDQSLWLVEKGKSSLFKAIKGLFIKEEDFVHAKKDGYHLHVRHPALGADNYDCMLTLSSNGKNEIIYPVPLASLEDVKLNLAIEAR
jgi:hypothetical protein